MQSNDLMLKKENEHIYFKITILQQLNEHSFDYYFLY